MMLLFIAAAEQVQDVHDTLLYIAYMNYPKSSKSKQVKLGKVEGFWKPTATATANTDQVFEGWTASSLATDTATNQLSL